MKIKERVLHDVDALVSSFTQLDENVYTNYDIYIFVRGGHTTSSFRQAKKLKGIEVKSRIFYGPYWLKPLGWLIAAEGGVLKINDDSSILQVLNTFSELALIEIVILPKERSKILNSELDKIDTDFLSILEPEPDFLYFMIDTDNLEQHPSQMYLVMAIGDNPHTSLINLFNSNSLVVQ